jgi:hypothetical protein
MDKTEKYLEYAQDCRRMAEKMAPEQKEKLLEIAKAWEECAAYAAGANANPK